MRKGLWVLLLLAVLGMCLPWTALAGETVTNQGKYFPMPGHRKIEGDLWVTGSVHAGTANADGSVFLTAITYCRGDTTTQQNGLIPVRVAANNWALERTAAGAETINYTCHLDSWLQRYGATTGIKITSVALAYQITVADATSHAFNGLKSVTYANNTANVVGSALTGTVTLSTASTTNPYLTSGAITTPAFFPSAANMGLNLDATVVLATNGVFRLYGVQVNFTRADN